MNWWIVGGIVWLVLALWCWCIVRVGALADQQIEDCWELDALTPKTVDQIIRAQVEPLIDQKAWTATMEAEEEHRTVLAEIISDWGRTKAAPAMLDYIRSVSGEPVEGEELEDGKYEHVDTATLVRVIDGADEVLNKHDL